MIDLNIPIEKGFVKIVIEFLVVNTLIAMIDNG